jgi:hypothetical protein
MTYWAKHQMLLLVQHNTLGLKKYSKEQVSLDGQHNMKETHHRQVHAETHTTARFRRQEGKRTRQDRHDTRTWRDRVTPTSEEDISSHARLYMQLVEAAKGHLLALSVLGSTDEDEALKLKYKAKLDDVRRQVRENFKLVSLFDDVVQSKIR